MKKIKTLQTTVHTVEIDAQELRWLLAAAEHVWYYPVDSTRGILGHEELRNLILDIRRSLGER